MAGGIIGALRITLGLDTAAFDRDTNKAVGSVGRMQNKMVGAGRAIGAAFAAIGISSLIRDAVEMASELDETSQKVGVTVESLQELRLAADQTGVATETLEGALAKLNKSLGDLERRKTATVKAFREIGLEADDLRGKRPDEALRMIADGLNALPTLAERVSVGQQIMGRSFSELLPLLNGGSEALERYAQQSQAMGQVSTEDARKLDELADRWDAFKTAVTIATANVVAGIVPMAQKVGEFLDETRAFFARVHDTAVAMPRAVIAAMQQMVTGIGTWITGRLNAIWDGAVAKIHSVESAFQWLWDKVVGHSHIPDLVDGIRAEMARLDAVMVKPVTDATSKAEAAFRDMAGQIRGTLDRLFPDEAASMRYDAERALLGNIADPDARARALAALAGDYDSYLKGRDGDGIGKRGADSMAKPLTALDEQFAKVLDGIDAMADRAEVATVRVAKSFKDMADDTLNALSQLLGAIKGGGFLSILESVIGLGLQLGSTGLFGKGVAARLNGTTSVGRTGASVPRGGDRASALVEIVDTTGLFVTRVNGQIATAAPSIVQASVGATTASLATQQSRRWR